MAGALEQRTALKQTRISFRADAFFDLEGSVSGVAAFQPREQLRYNGVRKVRAVRVVRTEEMSILLRKTTEWCKT
jgi:hypothetical protein